MNAMREPHELLDHLDNLVVELDTISKTQDQAANDEAKALDGWEQIYDEFVELLENEDRKGAFPSKERVESMCRRKHREEWREVKRAQLRLEKANRRAANVKQQIGGLQSTLKTLGTEASGPQPQWSRSAA